MGKQNKFFRTLIQRSRACSRETSVVLGRWSVAEKCKEKNSTLSSKQDRLIAVAVGGGTIASQFVVCQTLDLSSFTITKLSGSFDTREEVGIPGKYPRARESTY